MESSKWRLCTKEFMVAAVRRLLQDAKRRMYSGVWLSVEEVEAVLMDADELREDLEAKKAIVEPEPAPIPNSGTPVWDLVMADMQARKEFGRQKYGTCLQAHNGRDALKDAYQEALDLCVYLRQAIEEREGA